MSSDIISISVTIKSDIHTVWKSFTETKHIVNWYFASPDWHAPTAEHDFNNGGKFSIRMEAWDESFGFDYTGTYDKIVDFKEVVYTLDDGRKVDTSFMQTGDEIVVSQDFQADEGIDVEMQRMGWQGILNQLKKYVESKTVVFEVEADINASADTVWDCLTKNEIYKKWSKAFSPNSEFKGDWDKGKHIDYIDIGKGGTRALVEGVELNKFIQQRHIATITAENEIDTKSDSAKHWIGTIENYTLKDIGGAIRFTVHIECHEQFREFIESSWNTAILDFKRVCESV